MKAFERITLLANVLTAVCKRPAAEVGKLVKAVVTYVTEGTRTDLDDLRLQAYYELLIQDIDSLRTAAFAHTQRLQGDLSSRSYLYVYLRDKEWAKATSPVTQQGGTS